MKVPGHRISFFSEFGLSLAAQLSICSVKIGIVPLLPSGVCLRTRYYEIDTEKETEEKKKQWDSNPSARRELYHCSIITAQVQLVDINLILLCPDVNNSLIHFDSTTAGLVQ